MFLLLRPGSTVHGIYGSSPPPNPAQNLGQNLVTEKLAKNLANKSSDQLTGNCPENRLNLSNKNLPQPKLPAKNLNLQMNQSESCHYFRYHQKSHYHGHQNHHQNFTHSPLTRLCWKPREGFYQNPPGCLPRSRWNRRCFFAIVVFCHNPRFKLRKHFVSLLIWLDFHGFWPKFGHTYSFFRESESEVEKSKMLDPGEKN